MQINSADAIRLGREIHEAFGSWQKAREAAVLRDGVYVISQEAFRRAKSARAEAAGNGA